MRTKMRTKITAIEILKCEFSIIKNTNRFPPKEKEYLLEKALYKVRCDTVNQDNFSKWRLTAFKGSDSITSIEGALTYRIKNDSIIKE